MAQDTGPATVSRTSFVDRMIGAAKLDSAIYREVEHDHEANWQAVGVVLLVSLASAIGGARHGTGGFFFGFVVALGAWLIASGIVLFIGTKILPEKQTEADWGQVMRCMAFAYSPAILTIFAIIPFLSGVIFFGTWVWVIIATVIAVQEALDYTETWRAAVVVLLGWIVFIILRSIYLGAYHAFK